MKTKRWIALLLAIVTLGTLALSLVGCDGGVKGNTKEPPDVVEEEPAVFNPKEFHTELIDSEDGVVTLAATPMIAAANTVQQTLTASVKPATANNKAVDWSVAWGSSNNAAVTDYVTVTPISNGSTTATVICKKAFTGNIIITVTTRESGFTAECVVSYVGKPTSISVTSSLTKQSDGYHLGIGNAYTFQAKPTNVLGTVGSSYNNIEVSVTGVGSMILGYKEIYSGGGTTWWDASDRTVTLEELKNNFITVNYANGVVTVNTLKSIESYYGSYERLDSGRTKAYSDAFRSYVSDCYFVVKVTEKTSGVSTTFDVRFDDTVVTEVSLNQTELSF